MDYKKSRDAWRRLAYVLWALHVLQTVLLLSR